MIFKPCNIKIPKNTFMEKWSVVACDQYTSEPEYWQRVEEAVGDAPSTLHMIVPERYLDEANVQERIACVNETMDEYLKSSVFRTYKDTCVYVERTQADGYIRRGLIVAVDLEHYDFHKGSQTYIRASEGTVVERIPPRVRVRQHAQLEVPHIMLLIDDRAQKVIEKITMRADELEKLYRFQLMENGGGISGFMLDKTEWFRVEKELMELIDPDAYKEKYGVYEECPLMFAVGDGNHSLATAKQCYENLKKTIGTENARESKARYAMVEIVNVHDKALQFEPIHRVVFDANPQKLIEAFCAYYTVNETGDGQKITYLLDGQEKDLYVANPSSQLSVGTLQNFLDEYLSKNAGKIDYIHGENVVAHLCEEKGNIGFLLPKMEKSDLFLTVIKDGALPRKTFSMGHAWDKRYYLECRKIV